MRILVIILSLFTFNSCSNAKNQSSNKELVSNLFEIIELSGNEVSRKGATITFNLDKNMVYGTSGCNNFSGSFRLNNDTIDFGPIGATKKLCSDMALENELLKLLNGTKLFSVQDSILYLMENEGAILLKARLIALEQKDLQYKTTTFEYKAISRGTFLLISISNDGNYLTVATEPNMKPIKQTYTEEEWQNLMDILDKAAINEFPKLEPPSKKHQFDGAAGATLTVTVDGESYQTQTFDHGNPPEEISEIVKILLSFSEKE